MKKTLMTYILIVFTTTISIKTYSQIQFTNSDSVINFLVGNWIWTNSCGGFTGNVCTYPDSVGYTINLVFTKINNIHDSISYSRYKNDTLITSGRAKISYSNSIYGDRWNLENISGFTTAMMTLFFYSIDTIALADNCNDCFSHGFTRGSNLSSPDIELFDNKLMIFPNPCKSNIYFDLDSHLKFEKLTIYDLKGRSIKEMRNVNSSVDISELSNGIYFIELKNGKETFVTKVIKE